MIPIEKNNNLSIKLIDENGKNIGLTYPKRAKGLVKSGRARYKDETTLILSCLPMERSDKKVETKVKGLRKIEIPKYSLSEELMSAITHGIGGLLSIAALVLCVVYSAISHNVYGVVSTAIYGSTSVILYTMSTLYHAFKVNRAKKVFRIIDHCSIFLLIAGTYTPFALVTLREVNTALGWTVFGIIWGCASLGISLTAVDMNKFKKFSMILYIVMGWMITIAMKTLIASLAKNGLLFMLLGGIIYTIGAILYGIGKKVKYIHSVFHLFVLAASILFFFSIFFYVI